MLYYINFFVNDISGITGFCQKTVRKKIKTFNNQGFEALFARKKGVGRKSATASLINEIENDLETHDYRCSKQIQHILSFRFNIKLCLSSVRNILKKLNFKFFKSGSLPAKADPIAQRYFYDDVLHPLMQMAKENKCALFFMDGAYFVFGCEHLGSVWAKCRRFIKTFSGRKRLNVLGLRIDVSSVMELEFVVLMRQAHQALSTEIMPGSETPQTKTTDSPCVLTREPWYTVVRNKLLFTHVKITHSTGSSCASHGHFSDLRLSAPTSQA